MAPNSTPADPSRPPGGVDPPDTGTHSAVLPVRVDDDACFAVGTLLALTTLTRHRGEVVVVAHGEVDICSAPALLSELDGALLHPSCRVLIVDLRGVGFLSAHGIGVLLTIRLGAAAHGVRFALVADHHPVLRLLEITATTGCFALFPTIEAARGAA